MKTSWNKVSSWYADLVKDKGHYFHEHVVIPRVLKLLQLSENSSLIDLACGQGVLARHLPKNVEYQGIDISPNLVNSAKQQDKNPRHHYVVGDITKQISVINNFEHATIILALQNIERPQEALLTGANHLIPNGKLVIVFNHPCFRIPRQSSWGDDEINKLQYRRINRYLSPLKIPITMHPGKVSSSVTWSFHHSLSDYSTFLHRAGFLIEKIEEWTSDRESVGKARRQENRARSEFPLFLALLCRKR